jgi:FkbM family methyltransferase
MVPRGGSGALIYYQGAAEPETAEFLKRALKPGMVFVDVGAHLGEYTVLAADILKGTGHVHAFEPRPDIFELLNRNVQLNHCRNVTVRPCALWHENGVCDFEVTPEPAISAVRSVAAMRRGAKLIKVQAVTLNDYFAKWDVAKPNLIKIDVEGAELNVLQGARTVLEQPAGEAPMLLVEYEPPNQARFGRSFTEVYMFLVALGYNFYDWRKGNLVPVHKSGEDLVHTDNSPLLASTNLIAAKVPLAIFSTPNRCD